MPPLTVTDWNRSGYRHGRFEGDRQRKKPEIHRLNTLWVMMLVKVHVVDYRYISIEVIDRICSKYSTEDV